MIINPRKILTFGIGSDKLAAMNGIRTLGAFALEYLRRMGVMGLFFFKALFFMITPPLKFMRLLKQIRFVGLRSVLVIVLTGGFSGMVLG
ncbi:MAG: hypothetical protein WCB49_02435, partial [Gammaproteobacteria bacterium]